MSTSALLAKRDFKGELVPPTQLFAYTSIGKPRPTSGSCMRSARQTAEALLLTSIRGNRQEEPNWQAGYASMTTSNGRNLLYKEFARQARHHGFACRVPHWNNGRATVVSIEYASDTDPDTS